MINLDNSLPKFDAELGIQIIQTLLDQDSSIEETIDADHFGNEDGGYYNYYKKISLVPPRVTLQLLSIGLKTDNNDKLSIRGLLWDLEGELLDSAKIDNWKTLFDFISPLFHNELDVLYEIIALMFYHVDYEPMDAGNGLLIVENDKGVRVRISKRESAVKLTVNKIRLSIKDTEDLSLVKDIIENI